MSENVYPIWVYVAVATAIALAAFGLGQVNAKWGMPFAIGASTLWFMFVQSRRGGLGR